MILHRYFARRFLISFAIITAVLFSLILLVDIVEQTRKFGSYDLAWKDIMVLTLLNVPQTLNLILPLIMILATVALFIALARSSEMVVTRAAGRSALESLAAPVFVALVIGLLAVTVLNPIVAATSKRYIQLSDRYRAADGSAFSVSEEGLWLRQGSASGQIVISALRSNADASELFDVTFVAYARGKGPERRIDAASARLTDGEWVLSDVKSWPLARGTNAEGNAQHFDTLKVPSSLTLERIRESIGKPAAVSIYDLPKFIRQLQQAGFSTRRHQVWLQTEIARPLFLVAMVLIASAFTMRHTRFGGTGVAVLISVLLGFTLYFIRSFAQILGENGQIPIFLSAWAPPFAATMLALGLLLHAEDG